MITIILAICLIIQFIACIFIGWSGIIAFLGLTKKIIPVRSGNEARKNRFAVVVCARNEEKVLPILFNSLMKQDYPQNCWHVYLLADHCTDETVRVAKQFPFVTVYEKTGDSAKGKGAVLSWGIRKLLKERGEAFDAMLFFDADNIADSSFISNMNDHLNRGNEIVQGFRIAGLPYRTVVTKWYALYWPIYSYIYSYPREKMGLSCFLTGTGFAVSKKLLKKHSWKTSSITEDVEYSFQQCLRSGRVSFCIHAVCYDEQPSSFSVMLRQLTRWCTGNYEILRTYFGKWFAEFRCHPSARLFDNLALLLIGPCSCMVFLITIILSFVYAKISLPLVLIHLTFFVLGYLVTAAAAAIIARYQKMPVRALLGAILTFPLFLWIYTLCSAYSILCPQRKWKTIAHSGLSDPDGGKKEEKIRKSAV